MRKIEIIVSFMLILVATTSCTAHPNSTTSGRSSEKGTTAMKTPEQAKEEVRALYEATRDLMRGDWVEYTRDWSPCTTPEGDEGASYDLFSQRREQGLPADPRTVVEQAQQVWAKLGHPVKIDQDKTLVPTRWILSDPGWMAGSGPDGLLLRFSVGGDYADFMATSRCATGDPLELSLAE